MGKKNQSQFPFSNLFFAPIAKNVIVLFCVVISYGCLTNKTFTKELKIVEITLLNNFEHSISTGYDAQDVYSLLNGNGVETIKIDGKELETIKNIISSSKTIKYSKGTQDKGIHYDLMYLEIKDGEYNNHRVFIASDYAFYDLDEHVYYKIDSEQRTWIRQFQEKYRGKSIVWQQ